MALQFGQPYQMNAYHREQQGVFIKCSNGDVIHVFIYNEGDIYYRRSTNDGVTWGSSIAIHTWNFALQNLDHIDYDVAPNGTIVFVASSSLEYRASGYGAGFLVFKSTDNGNTWTKVDDWNGSSYSTYYSTYSTGWITLGWYRATVSANNDRIVVTNIEQGDWYNSYVIVVFRMSDNHRVRTYSLSSTPWGSTYKGTSKAIRTGTTSMRMIHVTDRNVYYLDSSDGDIWNTTSVWTSRIGVLPLPPSGTSFSKVDGHYSILKHNNKIYMVTGFAKTGADQVGYVVSEDDGHTWSPQWTLVPTTYDHQTEPRQIYTTLSSGKGAITIGNNLNRYANEYVDGLDSMINHKTWNGTSYQPTKAIKVWNGTSFVKHTTKRWNGTSFIEIN